MHNSAKADSSRSISLLIDNNNKNNNNTIAASEPPTTLKKPDRLLLLPQHIAFICDGNSRWSRKRMLHNHSSRRTSREIHVPNNNDNGDDGRSSNSRRHQEVAGREDENGDNNNNNINNYNRGITSSLARSMMGHIAGAKRVVGTINMLLSIMKDQQQQQQQQQKKKHNQQHHDYDRMMTTTSSDDKNTNNPTNTMNNIQYCTLFAFSTENWSRPNYEINAIFALIERISRRYRLANDFFHEGKVRFRLLGDIKDVRIPVSTRKELYELVRCSNLACDERRSRSKTKTMIDGSNNDQQLGINLTTNRIYEYNVTDDDDDDDIPTLTICLAINYGGRADILRAATEYAQSIIDASLSTTHANTTTTTITPTTTTHCIDENEITKRLCTATIPNVDLIVRTGGECRLSNFFLWESAYAELYFCDTLWPDFDDVALYDALSWYSSRERRFGGR